MDRLVRRLIVFKGADIATFALFFLLIGAGAQTERNPILQAIMAVGGWPLVVVVECAVLGAVASLAARRPTAPVRSWYPKARAFFVNLAAASGLVGAAFNSVAIIVGLATA